MLLLLVLLLLLLLLEVLVRRDVCVRARRQAAGAARSGTEAAASERVSASCSVWARATSGAVGSAGFEKLPTEDVRAAAGRDCRLLQAAGIEPANV